VVLLCQVREVEVAGEGACDLLGANGRERVDELLRVFDRGIVLLLVRVDGELSKPLDVVEQLCATSSRMLRRLRSGLPVGVSAEIVTDLN
jgi:hypothetical protein